MNLSLYIAKRYLLSKKSHRVINIISWVAVAGVTLATMAMVCTLSVFNGFQELVAEQFTSFDPDIKITAVNGKSFDAKDKRISDVTALPGVIVATRCIEDKAMIQYAGKQVMATIKGVEDNFEKLTDISRAMIGDSIFLLHDSIVQYAIPGAAIASELNSGIHHIEPFEVFAPRRGKKVNITNPAANFKKGFLHSSGAVFAVNQAKYDNNYIITSIDFARNIFERNDNEITSLELRTDYNGNNSRIKQQIAKILGYDFVVKDRYEQQEDIFRIMKIEKFISYLFLSFILLVACFNIIGSLSMLILDKKRDMETLRNLGAGNKLIANIFIIEGTLISTIGAVAGIALGLLLCLLQQHFGLLSLGNDNGSFIIDSYPMAVKQSDMLLIFTTVLIVGFFAVGIPVRLLTKRIFKEN